VVTEWKVIPLEFLDLQAGDMATESEKAKLLENLGVAEILNLKFHRREKFKKGTIQSWLKKDVKAQLKSYICTPEISKLVVNRRFHAYLVLVVGSRKILVWEMDTKGNWIGRPVLAEKML